MVSEKLRQELDMQMKYEFHSSYLYLSMAAYCATINYDGFEQFMLAQVDEEKFHIMKFYNYLKERNVSMTFPSIEAPKHTFTSIENLFTEALAHEQFVTSRIYKLMDIASEEKEHATISFLQWFIDEQVEEEKLFEDWVNKIKQVEGNGFGLLMLSEQAGQRTFTPPTN